MKARIIIILTILALITFSIAKTFGDNNYKSILFGFASSSLVVLVIETVGSIKDYFHLASLSKNYRRIKIPNTLDNKHPNGIYKDLTQLYFDKGVSSEITLEYKGEGEYQGEAFYEQGKVKFTICLDETNLKIGVGAYQHIEKMESYEMPDLGTYIIQVNTNNTEKIFIYYSNIAPNELAKGYVIWTK